MKLDGWIVPLTEAVSGWQKFSTCSRDSHPERPCPDLFFSLQQTPLSKVRKTHGDRGRAREIEKPRDMGDSRKRIYET